MCHFCLLNLDGDQGWKHRSLNFTELKSKLVLVTYMYMYKYLHLINLITCTFLIRLSFTSCLYPEWNFPIRFRRTSCIINHLSYGLVCVYWIYPTTNTVQLTKIQYVYILPPILVLSCDTTHKKTSTVITSITVWIRKEWMPELFLGCCCIMRKKGSDS